MTDTHDRRASAWPTHLRPGAIRIGRASVHYDETIAFYRDVIGLPVIGEFKDSFGEDDGTIFGLPDTSLQIEIIRAHLGSGRADTFDQLVLYLDDAAAVTTATAELRRRGYQAERAQHPYWQANGAETYRDPDGRDVVYAPWVYGRDPEPIDRDTS
jgi:catechol 2,3-dioxygenase-like lactoylglutathione lyase family enzyme